MIPSTLSKAVSLVVQIAAIQAPPPSPPAPAALLSSSSTLAASLKVSFPDPGRALLPQPYWWWQSGTAVEALLTYGSTTGDLQYEDLLKTTILSQATPANDFMTVDATGNDDQAWWGLAAITAAELKLPQQGPVAWVDLATNVFNQQKQRWIDGNNTCGGGLRWKVDFGEDGQNGWHYKNAITNGLFFQLAARIAHLTKDAEILSWAEKTYAWSTKVGLVDQDFNVYDGTSEDNGCSDLNHNMWSYNVGVYMYGAAVMAVHTKDEKWADRTKGFVASAKRNFVNQDTGALFESKCEAKDAEEPCDTDQVSFKGLLARWLGATAVLLPQVKEDVEKIVNPAANAVHNGTILDLGPIESAYALEVVDASLRMQGLGGEGTIGVGKVKAARSIAGRIAW
ncbi:hypothetical protein J4E81_001685 [Alternaria sp. BMP 2799]|nr:hypothetical protein J4E81_001685 [Alternaria sp. BMP 2799]